jgi:hypothetical protein
MEKRTVIAVISVLHLVRVHRRGRVLSIYSTMVLVQKALLVLLHQYQYQYQAQATVCQLQSVNIIHVRRKRAMGRKKDLYVVQMASSTVTNVSLISPSVTILLLKNVLAIKLSTRSRSKHQQQYHYNTNISVVSTS